jgi:hypothetical protein
MSRRSDQSQALDRAALQRAILVGTPLQMLTVLLGHFGGLLAAHAIGFLFAEMMISATVGYLYAQDVAKGYGRGAYGGAIAGGVCALVGIAVSVPLGDMTPDVLVLRTLICVLTGAVGGVYGQLAADWSR